MWSIVILILIGMFLLMAELVLLPGVSVAGVGAFVSYGIGIFLGFSNFGTLGGFIILAVAILTAVVVVIVSLKSKTWQRFALKNNIDSKSQELPEEHNVKVGDKATTITRLAPMGKIYLAGETYEAKTVDSYIDQKSEVEVVGFENFTVVVKRIDTINQ